MRRVVHFVIVAVLAAEALVLGQGADAARVLASVRQALGGEEKVSAVKALTVVGRSTRTRPDGTSAESDFELSIALPDKYMKRDVVVAMGPTSIYRNAGFNGDGLINETDVPPSLSSGGNVRIMMAGPGSAPPGSTTTPEQVAEAKRKTLVGFKQDFARLALGMFGASFAAFPVEFKSAGTAESADGTADVLDVTGADGFTAKLFVDSRTHLPLMLSWMDKEPLVMQAGGPNQGGRGFTTAGGGDGVVTTRFGGPGRGRPSPEEIAQMQQDLADRMKEADAKRRVVEYRIFYGDYKTVDGVKLPTRVQRMVDGQPSEELAFDSIKVNPKVDLKKFAVSK